MLSHEKQTRRSRREMLIGLNAPFGAHLAGLSEIVACNSANSPSRFEVRTLILCGFLVLVDTCSGELHARFCGARFFLTKGIEDSKGAKDES